MSKRRRKSGEIQISKSGLTNFATVFVLTIIIIVGFIALSGSSSNSVSSDTSVSTLTQTGDQQIIEVTAKGGYSPRSITAKANTPTILKLKTNNTYDCSSAFSIPSLKIRKNLPANGITEFDLGSQAPGTKLIGTCSMGMYRFTINFEA